MVLMKISRKSGRTIRPRMISYSTKTSINSTSSIELSGVSVQAGKRSILRNVSLSFFAPLTYLIGLNGSGKTTLLRAITGETRFSGVVGLNGIDSATVSPGERARSIAIVHQRLNLPFQLTVGQFILMGRYNHLGFWGQYTQGDHQRAEEEMRRMKIQELKERSLDAISGGELQKVLLARALCQDTEWLLLDEPGQQLDPKNRKFLYEMLEQIARDGKKIICTTHDKEAILTENCHVVGMREGEIVYSEAKEHSWDKIWEIVYS